MTRMDTILAIDVGGSGAKLQRYDSRLGTRGEMVRYDQPDWERFDSWLASKLDFAPSLIGVSSAGFVDREEGVVRLARVAGWVDRPLVRQLEARFPGSRVAVVNDAEAHLLAHLDQYPAPMLCLALGTSPALAVSLPEVPVLRPRSGLNFDIGSMRLETRATNKEAWWALGTKGLRELQAKMGELPGTLHFGHRLGSLLANLAILFFPERIVVSGGIVERWWREMEVGVLEELTQRFPSFGASKELPQCPKLIASPHGASAALRGAALAALGLKK